MTIMTIDVGAFQAAATGLRLAAADLLDACHHGDPHALKRANRAIGYMKEAARALGCELKEIDQ